MLLFYNIYHVLYRSYNIFQHIPAPPRYARYALFKQSWDHCRTSVPLYSSPWHLWQIPQIPQIPQIRRRVTQVATFATVALTAALKRLQLVTPCCCWATATFSTFEVAGLGDMGDSLTIRRCIKKASDAVISGTVSWLVGRAVPSQAMADAPTKLQQVILQQYAAVSWEVLKHDLWTLIHWDLLREPLNVEWWFVNDVNCWFSWFGLVPGSAKAQSFGSWETLRMKKGWIQISKISTGTLRNGNPLRT